MQADAPNSSRASFWEGAQTALLSGNLLWTTLCLGGYRAETMVVTSVLTCAMLVVHAMGRACGAWTGAPHPAGCWLLPFGVYAAANAFFISPVPWLGELDALRWANLLAVGWVALNDLRSKGSRRVVFLTLVALSLVAVFLGCYQRFVRPEWLMLGRVQAGQFLGRASGPFGIPNSLGAWLLLVLPAAGALAARRRATAIERVAWGWVALVMAFGLALTISRGAWLALAGALVLWPLGRRGWRWPRRVTVAAAMLAAIVCAGTVVAVLSPKTRDRLHQLVQNSGEQSRPILWRAAWELFRERPVWGTGAGSYNPLFERHRPRGFVDEPQWAHNDYLNVLSDYGALGFGLLCGGAGLGVWQSRSRRHGSEAEMEREGLDEIGPALGVGLLAFALHAAVDFPFQLPALGMAFAVVSALWLTSPRSTLTDEAATLVGASRIYRYGWLAIAAAVAAAAFPVTAIYRAEALRSRARQAIDACVSAPRDNQADVLRRAEADLRRAVGLEKKNAQAWCDLAFALERSIALAPVRATEQAAAMEAAARQALSLSTAMPEFWIRLGVALDLQGRDAEARIAFERARQVAPQHPHAWYYYAHHLARDPSQQAAAREAVATCLALDPGNRAADALREKLNARRESAPLIP